MPLERVTPLPLVPRSSLPTVHAFGTDARCVPCKVLKNAIRAVQSRWGGGKRPRSTGPEEVTELLGLVATAIHQAADTSPNAPTPTKAEPRIHTALGRRMLEVLRSEVVEGWREVGVPDTELLPLLVAMERVRVTLQANWAQTFAQQLSGSDGLALLMDVAHDLRSPLTSILVLAETLQRGQSGPVNDAQRRQLGLIYTAALGLSSVASDIIEFTQGGDPLLDQEPSAFSVTAMLESVRDIVRPIAEEKHLTIRLLAPTHDQRIGHPVGLSRVLLNLTTNALKFTDEGYVEIVAQEVGDAGSNRIEFAVRDSGRGIPSEKVTTIFQPLRKESGRRGQLFSQTGLGLTICRKLVGAMKSELKVESREGWGTRFFFELTLPVIATRRSGPSPRRTPRPSGTHPVRNSGHHAPRNSDPQRRKS